MEKSMADQFIEQQQAAQEQQQQQSQAEKGDAEQTEAEKDKGREYQPEHITPPQPQQEQPSRHIDLDSVPEFRMETAKLNERQSEAMQNHLQGQMPEKSSADIENIRNIGDAEVGKLSPSQQQREQEQEELER